jgi:hypothetical protein
MVGQADCQVWVVKETSLTTVPMATTVVGLPEPMAAELHRAQQMA